MKKDHLIAILFDLEKVCDSKWKYCIIRDQNNLGLGGRLPGFLSNFLLDRNFKVRVESTISDLDNQEGSRMEVSSM